MWFLLSSCLLPRVKGRGGAVQRACVNSASDCYVVFGGRKDLMEETKSFLWAGGESMQEMAHSCASCTGVERCCRDGGSGSCALLPRLGKPPLRPQPCPGNTALSWSSLSRCVTWDGAASLARGEQLCPPGAAVVVSSQTLAMTSRDGAREQHSTAPHWGCTAKSGKCPCINPCALWCCWAGH